MRYFVGLLNISMGRYSQKNNSVIKPYKECGFYASQKEARDAIVALYQRMLADGKRYVTSPVVVFVDGSPASTQAWAHFRFMHATIVFIEDLVEGRRNHGDIDHRQYTYGLPGMERAVETCWKGSTAGKT